LIKEIAKILITLYRIMVSPLLPPSCKFHPTCSEYAHKAFSTKTSVIALYLSLRRLGRCHPFSDGGFDPVPWSVEEKGRVKEHLLSAKEVF
jgi:putative membrane protein insertion efficiency factor